MNPDELLARVQSMAQSVKGRPWQHEAAFNYALRACNTFKGMGRDDMALLVQCEMEMNYPEFPVDFGGKD